MVQIQITKERECKLLDIRINAFKSIITNCLTQFFKQNMVSFKHMQFIQVERMNNCNINNANIYILNKASEAVSGIISTCKTSIKKSLSDWNGVRKSKKYPLTFKQYFCIARNTFDQRKPPIIAKKFWSPLFDLINQVRFIIPSIH